MPWAKYGLHVRFLILHLDKLIQIYKWLDFLFLEFFSSINGISLKLTDEDFVEVEMLEDLQLGHNSLKSLGGDGNESGDGSGHSALYPLRSLKCLNLTHNELREFSFASLRGLRELRLLDISNNKVARLFRGRPPSEVRQNYYSIIFIGLNLYLKPFPFENFKQ